MWHNSSLRRECKYFRGALCNVEPIVTHTHILRKPLYFAVILEVLSDCAVFVGVQFYRRILF